MDVKNKVISKVSRQEFEDEINEIIYNCNATLIHFTVTPFKDEEGNDCLMYSGVLSFRK